jgi:multisubunit Na+/H+ antiporter MnhE subunit
MGFVVLFAIDSVTALVLLGFFFWGLTDRSVSSFNSALARPIGSVAAILVGSLILRARVGRAWRMACLRFWLGPVCLTGFFFLVLILVPARWN